MNSEKPLTIKVPQESPQLPTFSSGWLEGKRLQNIFFQKFSVAFNTNRRSPRWFFSLKDSATNTTTHERITGGPRGLRAVRPEFVQSSSALWQTCSGRPVHPVSAKPSHHTNEVLADGSGERPAALGGRLTLSSLSATTFFPPGLGLCGVESLSWSASRGGSMPVPCLEKRT